MWPICEYLDTSWKEWIKVTLQDVKSKAICQYYLEQGQDILKHQNLMTSLCGMCSLENSSVALKHKQHATHFSTIMYLGAL